MIPAAPLSSIFPQVVLENGYDHLRDQSPNGGYMNYGVQLEGVEPTYLQVWGWDRQMMLFVTHTLFFSNGLPLFSDPCVTERVFDYVGGHINDQSDLQRTHFQSLSSVNAHQEREMEALRLQTQQLSVRFLQLLGDHLSLINCVRTLQDIVAADDFFRTLLPLPFVSSFERDDGQGEDSPSESSGDSDSDLSPSTPSQSFQTCASGDSSQEEGLRPPIRPSRTSSVWIPAEQGPIVYPFRSPSADADASPDGDSESGSVAWEGDGEGSTDGYVVGDEASSPAQRLRVSELSVGGEEREGSVEAV